MFCIDQEVWAKWAILGELRSQELQESTRVARIRSYRNKEVQNKLCKLVCCKCRRIREQSLYPKIQDQHLPGEIFAKLPDSLAPELPQLLTPEFLPPHCLAGASGSQ
jgi:hypothetical protein